jgi:hypothetical protein
MKSLNMISIENTKLLNYADDLLTIAEHEQFRAEEDAVTHLICSNARQSLLYFMTVFLLKSGVLPHSPATLASMLKQCKQIDARFDTVDLSYVKCRFSPRAKDYCLERHQVDRCMEAAQLVRSIVMSETPPY